MIDHGRQGFISTASKMATRGRTRIAVACLGLLVIWLGNLAHASAAQSKETSGSYAPSHTVQETDTMAQIHHAQPAAYSHTLRITFAYDGEKLDIAGVTRVAMRAPAPATPSPNESQVGYWLEVRDASGTLLYHRPLHDPIRQDVESFGDKPGDPIRRVPGRHPKGEFEVLIPDLPEATEFMLHGPPIGKAAARSAVLARYGLPELRRLATGGSSGNQPGTQGSTP